MCFAVYCFRFGTRDDVASYPGPRTLSGESKLQAHFYKPGVSRRCLHFYLGHWSRRAHSTRTPSDRPTRRITDWKWLSAIFERARSYWLRVTHLSRLPSTAECCRQKVDRSRQCTTAHMAYELTSTICGYINLPTRLKTFCQV